MERGLIKAENLNQKAYERIKQAILLNELRSGTNVVDSQISEKFGISRTPVRDAIQMLTREGLIENKGKRYYVFSASEKDVNEIYDIRLMIDKEAISKIINVLLQSNYEFYDTKLNQIYSDVRKHENKTGIGFVKADEIFHYNLISLAGNSRLAKMYTNIRNQSKAFKRISSYNEQRVKSASESHKKLISAIKDKKFDLAIQVLTDHVELCRNDALRDVLQPDKLK